MERGALLAIRPVVAEDVEVEAVRFHLGAVADVAVVVPVLGGRGRDKDAQEEQAKHDML